MKPGKKPIETTKKSTLPADQRDSVAHENAIAASRLRKAAGERQMSADEQAAEMVKGEGFYHGSDPTLNLHQDVSEACETTFSKSLSACPECGDGAVTSRPMPGMPHLEHAQTSDPSRGLLSKARNPMMEDVQIGGDVEPVRMVSHGGVTKRR